MPKKKDKPLAEGKTKTIWGVSDNPNLVKVENKIQITAFDDPKFTKEFKTKAVYATNTTCRVFELLKTAGIPVAFQEQISPTEFIAPKCRMIPLEVVARRYAVGSYLKRHPELEQLKKKPPHRFHSLVAEFFLKTTGGCFMDFFGHKQIDGLDPKKGEEDPLILNPYQKTWSLYHPKKPAWDPEADFHLPLIVTTAVGENIAFRIEMRELENILRKTFLLLEGAWAQLGLRLIDMKIEFGIGPNGELLVADVIDNDSWRLRDSVWKELSKQAFRDGEDLSEVEKKYGFVADLIKQIRIPHQALVIWKASKEDKFTLPEKLPAGVESVSIVGSGHKETQRCLAILEDIQRDFPDGGAIICKVGRSNGLGPTLATHTIWPVSTVPPDWEEKPHSIWSHIDMPSRNPHGVYLYEHNAVLAALGHLAQKNPAVYMELQYEMEKLDPGY